MIHPYYEQRENAFVVIPTVSVCTDSCPCSRDVTWIFTIDFALWSLGFAWTAH